MHSIAQNTDTFYYDSLSNSINRLHLNAYQGQIIYIPRNMFLSNIGFKHFFSKEYSSAIYKKNKKYFDTSLYESLAGRYFKIQGIKYHDDFGYFELNDTASHEIIYYEVLPSGEFTFTPEFIFCSYISKMNSIYQGQYLYLDINNLQKCIGVFYDEKHNNLFLRFENGESKDMTDNLFEIHNTCIEINGELTLRKKYEEIYGKVKIGMRKNIVLLVKGKANNITSVRDKNGLHEILHFNNEDVFIDNDRVTSISLYK